MTRSLRLPIVLLVVALAAVAGLFIATRLRRQSAKVATLPPLQALQVVPGASALVVEQASGGDLLVQTASGSRRVSLPPGLPIELLRPALASAIQPGDWLSVGGVANQVNSFALKQLILIPAGEANALGDLQQPPRSKDGFTGFEGELDPKIGPAVYGRVRQVASGTVTLEGAAGVLTLRLPPETPILRLQSGDIGQIQDGDRLVFAGSADPASATAVLARP